ncbi:unnamed protein product [Caenorhabditis auriculariae]|uniref:Uncharacterized protein n=1 Tax=Caenorhabditis auriculariae TaxID=2777116 RepID=A0A8S1HB12_9PELO|nr:unnamed protein product [Caenorhabditis auriculariae]
MRCFAVYVLALIIGFVSMVRAEDETFYRPMMSRPFRSHLNRFPFHNPAYSVSQMSEGRPRGFMPFFD